MNLKKFIDGVCAINPKDQKAAYEFNQNFSLSQVNDMFKLVRAEYSNGSLSLFFNNLFALMVDRINRASIYHNEYEKLNALVAELAEIVSQNGVKK